MLLFPQRRAGEMLAGMEKNKGAATRSTDSTASPTLSEIGINKNESSTWQKIATIPDEEFEQKIAILKKNPEKVTTKSLVAKIKKEERLEDIQRQVKEIAQATPEAPQGLFHVICIDPPWPYGNENYDPYVHGFA